MHRDARRSTLPSFIWLVVATLVLWGGSYAIIHYAIGTSEARSHFGDAFGAINALFAGLALAGVAYSLVLQQRAVRADHDRRRNEATLDYLRSIRSVYIPLHAAYKSAVGNVDLTEAMLPAILKDRTLVAAIKEYLATLEHLSVGANLGVFDVETINRMNGSYLVRQYRRFQPYIEHARKRTPLAYEEFESLVGTLLSLRSGD